MRRLIIAVAILYFAVFTLTFGHEGNRYDHAGDRYARNTGFFAGLFWPIYWPMRLSWDYFEQASE